MIARGCASGGLLASLILLGGCVAGTPAPIEDRRSPARVQDPREYYTVLPGDTLYSIAFRFGLDYRSVGRINGIAQPYIIYPGQRILVRGVDDPGAATQPPAQVAVVPAATAPASEVGSTPPAPGQVIVRPAFPSGGVAPPPGPQPAPATPAPTPLPAATPGSAPAPGGEATPAATQGSASPQGVPPIAAPESRPTTAEPPVAPTPPASAAPVAAATPPASVPLPSGPVSQWRWPSSGPVSRSYSSSVHKGIDIAGNRGDPVLAAAPGQVVYAGTGIVGFGELIIVKHDDIHLSAYGHNDRLLVREGDAVAAGQQIAEKGSTGTDSVKLHFEIRREGKPVDPMGLLPAR